MLWPQQNAIWPQEGDYRANNQIYWHGGFTLIMR